MCETPSQSLSFEDSQLLLQQRFRGSFIAAITDIFSSLPARAATIETDSISPIPFGLSTIELIFRRNYPYEPPKFICWVLFKPDTTTTSTSQDPTLIKIKHSNVNVTKTQANVTIPPEVLQLQAGQQGKLSLYWIAYTQTKTNPILSKTLEQIFSHPASLSKQLEASVEECVKTCDINEGDRIGQTLLHAASCSGNAQLVDWLITHGANIDSRDEKGWSPMLAAVSSVQPETAQQLITSGASLKITCERGMSVLHVLCRWPQFNRKQVSLTRQIISSGLISINIKNDDNETPLLYLCKKREQCVPLATVFLELGADPNISDNNGITPLHIAATKDNIALSEILIQHGANALLRSNGNNKKDSLTPLQIASKHKNEQLLNTLSVISQLPNAILQQILRNLNPDDIINCSYVSKSFRNAATNVMNDIAYWKLCFGFPKELFVSLCKIKKLSCGALIWNGSATKRAIAYRDGLEEFVVLPEELPNLQPVARMLLTIVGPPKSGKQTFIREFCDGFLEIISSSNTPNAASNAQKFNNSNNASQNNSNAGGNPKSVGSSNGSFSNQSSSLKSENIAVGSPQTSTANVLNDQEQTQLQLHPADEGAPGVIVESETSQLQQKIEEETTTTTTTTTTNITMTKEEGVPFYSKSLVRLHGQIVELFLFALDCDDGNDKRDNLENSSFKQFWQLSAACILLVDTNISDSKSCLEDANKSLKAWRSVCSGGKDDAVLVVGYKSDSMIQQTANSISKFSAEKGFPFILAAKASDNPEIPTIWDDSIDFSVKVACEIASEHPPQSSNSSSSNSSSLPSPSNSIGNPNPSNILTSPQIGKSRKGHGGRDQSCIIS